MFVVGPRQLDGVRMVFGFWFSDKYCCCGCIWKTREKIREELHIGIKQIVEQRGSIQEIVLKYIFSFGLVLFYEKTYGWRQQQFVLVKTIHFTTITIFFLNQTI